MKGSDITIPVAIKILEYYLEHGSVLPKELMDMSVEKAIEVMKGCQQG